MVDIGNIEVNNVFKIERVGAHSHIRGLGIKSNLEPFSIGSGMVGQCLARKAAGLIVQMIKVLFLNKNFFIVVFKGRTNCWPSFINYR